MKRVELPKGARSAVLYAVEILESEIDIRENEDVGNREMKKQMRVLQRLLAAIDAPDSKR